MWGRFSSGIMGCVLICTIQGCHISLEIPHKLLICIASDALHPHTGKDNSLINTPAFERIAEKDIYFSNASTPNAKRALFRSFLLKGWNTWQLKAAYFQDSYEQKPPRKAFCLCYVAFEPHRSHKHAYFPSLDRTFSEVDQAPAFFPNNGPVRTDMMDYGIEKPKKYIVEFRLPMSTSTEKVKANGLTEIFRKWKSGDVILIDMDYLHI